METVGLPTIETLSLNASRLNSLDTFTTVELKINFFRPMLRGKLTAEAMVIKAGNTLGYVECDLKDQDGNLVTKAACTCMKLHRSGS